MDKYGYIMDILKNMQTKLSFSSQVYQQLSQKLSVLDTFKGIWKAKENLQGQYLEELRKIATIESAGSSTRIEGVKLTDQEVLIDPSVQRWQRSSVKASYHTFIDEAGLPVYPVCLF